MSSEPVCLCVSVYRAWRQAFSCLSGVWKSVYKCVSVHCIGAKLGKPQKHSCNSSQHHPMQEETGQEWKFKKEKKGVREESSWCDIFCGWDSIHPPHTHTHKPVKFLPHFPHPLSSLQLAPSLSLFPLWCHVALQNAGDAASSRGCWGWSSVSKHSQSRGFGFTQMISNCFQSLSSHANRVEVHPLSLYKVDFGGDLNHKVH